MLTTFVREIHIAKLRAAEIVKVRGTPKVQCTKLIIERLLMAQNGTEV